MNAKVNGLLVKEVKQELDGWWDAGGAEVGIHSRSTLR